MTKRKEIRQNLDCSVPEVLASNEGPLGMGSPSSQQPRRRARVRLFAPGILVASLAAWSLPAADLVLLSPFHSGSVTVYDLSSRARVADVPVEDGAGVVGLNISRDGAAFYVVDGNLRHRLRRFETQGWKEAWEREFQHRVLARTAAPVSHLTADGRWLLITTFDMGAAASGVRIFDVERGQFSPLGLPLNGCERPAFASAPNGTVAAICDGRLHLFRSPPGETLSAAGVTRIPLKEAAGCVVTPRGDSVFVLGARLETAPWRLVQVSTKPGLQARPINLAALLGGAAKTQGEPRPSILDIDEEGRRLLIANGSDAWLLALSPLRLQRALLLAAAGLGPEPVADSETLAEYRYLCVESDWMLPGGQATALGRQLARRWQDQRAFDAAVRYLEGQGLGFQAALICETMAIYSQSALAARRIDLGLQQSQVAHRAGLVTSTICRCERDVRLPQSLVAVRSYAAALQLSEAELRALVTRRPSPATVRPGASGTDAVAHAREPIAGGAA